MPAIRDKYPFGVHFQKCVIGLALREPKFLEQYGDVLRREYFDNPAYGHLLEIIQGHVGEYRRVPSKEILPTLVVEYAGKLNLNQELTASLQFAFQEALTIDLSDADWVREKAKEFAQYQEFRNAIIEGAELLKEDNSQSTYSKIVKRIEKATNVGASRDLGLNLKDHGPLVHKYLKEDSPFADSRKVKTGLIRLDSAMLGGLGPGELGVVMARSGGGKLLADHTPVLTTCGWKLHGELAVGDLVFGLDGQPTRVMATTLPESANVRVEFQDGSVFYCHEKHDWVLYDSQRDSHGVPRGVRVVETSELLAQRLQRGNGSRYTLPHRGCLVYEEVDLPLHPYALGVWLGDGTSSASNVTHCVEDSPVVDRVASFGYPISTNWVHKTTGVVTTSFGSGVKGYRGPFWDGLDKAGVLNNKHIPTSYKESSREQRLLLLAGLVDTDGYVSGSKITVSTCSMKLADDIAEVVTSLGWKPWRISKEPRLSTSGIQGKKVVYTVGFIATEELPVTLERKKNTPPKKYRRVGLLSVTLDPRGFYGKCIQVDREDGTYLVGKTLTPTHNSMVLTHFAAQAHRENHSVYYYTLELNATDVLVRLCASLTGIPIDDIVTNDSVVDSYKSEVAKFSARENNVFVKYFTTRTVGVLGIRSHLSYMASLTGVPPGVIFVDYADLLWTEASSFRSSEKADILGRVYEDLRALADQFQCPVWTASQSTRDSWRSAEEGGLIDIYEVAESAKKIHAADVVLTVSNTRKERDDQRAKLYIAKMRRGKSGDVIDCILDTSRARLREAAHASLTTTPATAAHVLDDQGDRLNQALGRGVR